MTTPLEIPATGTLDRALRAFLAFESDFAKGAESLDGMLAWGELTADRETGEMAPGLRDIMNTWPGPRNPNDQVLLAGDSARRLSERDLADDGPTGPMLSVDVLTTGRWCSVMRRYDEHRAVVHCESTSLRGRTPAEQFSGLDDTLREVGAGSAWAAEELGQTGLRQLAAADQYPVTVAIAGMTTSIPVLGVRGRLLDGASRFHDEAMTWVDDYAEQATQRSAEWARLRTAHRFVEAALPTLETARNNPRAFKAEMVALGARHRDLLGPIRPTHAMDLLTRRHLASFLTVPDRFAPELEVYLTIDPPNRQVASFGLEDVRATMELVTRCLRQPDLARGLD